MFIFLKMCFFWVLLLFLLYKVWVMFIRKYGMFFGSKKKSYECGFEGQNCSRLPFSLRFFMILVVFLIFDVELSFLLHIPFQSYVFFFKNRAYVLVFFTVLLLGLMEEWRRGIISWNF